MWILWYSAFKLVMVYFGRLVCYINITIFNFIEWLYDTGFGYQLIFASCMVCNFGYLWCRWMIPLNCLMSYSFNIKQWQLRLKLFMMLVIGWYFFYLMILVKLDCNWFKFYLLQDLFLGGFRLVIYTFNLMKLAYIFRLGVILGLWRSSFFKGLRG